MTRNMEMSVSGSVLTIVVDLSKNLGPSSTGKTNIVASSGGSVEIPGADGVKVGLNVFKRPGA